ncbi:MAG TPA: undecaprenyldiphospho-muramoylpentapeptide beta-N-acetylglucosaminyltransferase [Xanthomonadaceae bacterium]|nr:undecaprenyldiphospho-muramoylpentapeptide beta-N-acetylglucosaminyltransferase [Xanthomonadaceae bacterium]
MNAATAPVMILAGGTGGHIFPGIAVAQALRARDVPVVWLGSRRGLETELVPRAGFELETIEVSALRGRGPLGWLQAPLMLWRALRQSLAQIRRHRPRSVLSLGGFAAGPGGVAARLARVPLLVHEQNRVPGFTNRVLARLACRVMAGFPDAFPAGRAEWVGNPVRSTIAALAPPRQRMAGRTDAPRLLVLGGSQGARALNLAVPQVLSGLGFAVQVRHQCGARHLEATRAAYAGAGFQADVQPFLEDMAAAYGWADLVLCRAGALTLAELAAAGCAALLVPFPHAVDDHQTGNARFLVERGAAELVAESGQLADALRDRLAVLLPDRERLLSMATLAREAARPDAAERVARRCLEVAQ